jgi:hypothetical protein
MKNVGKGTKRYIVIIIDDSFFFLDRFFFFKSALLFILDFLFTVNIEINIIPYTLVES